MAHLQRQCHTHRLGWTLACLPACLLLRRAAQVRHCALSLVGEPIMYPEINTLVGLLHERRISTFLVTNAQVRVHTCAHTCMHARTLYALVLAMWHACPAPACSHP